MTTRCIKRTEVISCRFFSTTFSLFSKQEASVCQYMCEYVCVHLHQHCLSVIHVAWPCLTNLHQNANKSHCCMSHHLQLLAIIILQLTSRVSIKTLPPSFAFVPPPSCTTSASQGVKVKVQGENGGGRARGGDGWTAPGCFSQSEL